MNEKFTYPAENKESRDLCHLSRMFEEEKIISESPDHLILSRHDCIPICSVWRERVAQWYDDVLSMFDESRATGYIAMNMLDRYFAVKAVTNVSSYRYEVACLTALFLAVHINGRKSLTIMNLIRMSRLDISAKDILEAGKDITQSISLERRLLTPFDFITQMLEFLPTVTANRIREVVFINADIYKMDSTVARFKSSDIAMASILHELKCSDTSIFKSKICDISGCNLFDESVSELQAKIKYLKCMAITRSKPHVIPDTD